MPCPGSTGTNRIDLVVFTTETSVTELLLLSTPTRLRLRFFETITTTIAVARRSAAPPPPAATIVTKSPGRVRRCGSSVGRLLPRSSHGADHSDGTNCTLSNDNSESTGSRLHPTKKYACRLSALASTSALDSLHLLLLPVQLMVTFHMPVVSPIVNSVTLVL